MVPSAASHDIRPRSFSGWPLSTAVELDAACPSFLSFVFCGAALKRQAIFSTLAALTRECPEALATRLRPFALTDDLNHQTSFKQIARALMATRAREILQAVFGDVPDGFLGVLSRIGDEPLRKPSLYFTLFEIFSDPQHRARRDVLRQRSGSITATHIEVISRLDPILVHRNVLNRLYGASQADDANAALALVRSTVSSATDETIRQSIENLGEKTDLGALFSRWLEKVDRPPVHLPVPEDDPDLAVVTSGVAMASLGRRFRNCAASRTLHLAQGAQVLLEWRHPPGLVAQCHRLTNGSWVLTEIYAKRNGLVDPEAAAALRGKLEALGIPALCSEDAHPRTRGIMNLLGQWGGTGHRHRLNEMEPELDGLEREIAEAGEVV
ncbi:hypothetical protein ACFOYU_16305 [Microvirga sp. GCM10011540]|uniref:hypothetical protein n=1 Tax=Microvirga sp. GCM10011540 TaxID=3317338 RepID=UPI0036093FC9